MIAECEESSVDYITMWTVQSELVIDKLNEKGISYVKKQYIKEKYGETSWIFEEAYGFFVKNAEQLVPRPAEAESPVWLFADKRWAVPSEGSNTLKLQVPKKEIILFDLRSWSKVLNLSYLGTETQEMEFEQKLTKMGIRHSVDIFEQPYYPQLKSEVIKSWKSLFDKEEKDIQYTQGATWYIDKEWIVT